MTNEGERPAETGMGLDSEKEKSEAEIELQKFIDKANQALEDFVVKVSEKNDENLTRQAFRDSAEVLKLITDLVASTEYKIHQEVQEILMRRLVEKNQLDKETFDLDKLGYLVEKVEAEK